MSDKIYTTPEYSIDRVKPKHHTGADHFEFGKGWAKAEDEASSDLPLPKDAPKGTQRLRMIGPFLCALGTHPAFWSVVELQQDKNGRFHGIPESLQGSFVQLSDLERAINSLIGAKGEAVNENA